MNLLGAVMAGKDVLRMRKCRPSFLRGGRRRPASKAAEAGRSLGSRSASKASDVGSRSLSKATTESGGSPRSCSSSSSASCSSPAASRAESKSTGDESLCSGGASTSCSSSSSGRRPSVAELRELASAPGLEVRDLDLDATVGRGAFGRVRVVNLKGTSDAPMALKIMEKAKVLKMRQVQHVKDEMEILSSVDHPFIVGLLRTFHDSKRLYLLMEFVNGGDLDSLLKDRRRLAFHHAKFYAAQCTLALEYLHSMKIAYRDLKPKNTLIDCDGYLKLTDFGFAKVVDAKTFTTCGTPEYVAPEVIRGTGHDGGADWWSLGVLVFEMLQGSTPFAAKSVTEIYLRALAMKVDYPLHFQIYAADLIQGLLQDKVRRLGCGGEDAQEVKRHKWFGDIDWQDLYDRETPAPWVPSVSDASDSSCLRHYPEPTGSSVPELSVEEEWHFNFMQPNSLCGNIISV